MKFKYAPANDERLEKWVFEEEAQKILKYVKDGDVVFDIGANILDHSIYFALNRPNSKIYSFEPVKEYFEYGIKNCEDYKVSNVLPFNYAIGKAYEKTTISIDGVGSSIKIDHNKSTEDITIESIDDLILRNEVAIPNVIKLDIEGHALPALEGMANMLKNNKPIFILEIHPFFVGLDESLAKVKFLYDLGYKIVEHLNQIEFVLEFDKDGEDFETFIDNINVWFLSHCRWEYDKAKTKNDRNRIKSEYKIYSKRIHPISKWLLWSKLYVFFSGRIFKYR